MLNIPLLQWFVFPFGMLYLLLHAGPLFRLWYEPSIRGGTRWQFFASEVVLFCGYLFGAPAVWHSSLGRTVLVLHLSMHVVFTITDYMAHDFLLDSALCSRVKRPSMWVGKEAGLLIDTTTHAIAVALVAQAIGPLPALMLTLPALGAFALVTRGYLHRYGALILKGER